MDKNRTVQGYIALIFFAMFLYGLGAQMIGTLVSRIISHYNIQMAQAGLLTSFQFAGNFIAVLLVTIFSGRINKLILLGISVFFLAASFCFVSTAPLFGILLVNFSLMGIFFATLDTLVNSLTADLRPDSVKTSISFLHGLYALGGLLCPIIIERLAVKFGWTNAYFIISMVLVVYLVLYAVFVKSRRSQLSACLPPAQKARFGLLDMLQFFKTNRNILLWITMFLYGGSHSTMVAWIKRYVETHLNEPSWGVYVLSVMWLGTALSRIVVSPNIKIPSLQKIFIGNLISAAALIAGLLSGSVYGIAAASIAVGITSGFTVPLLVAQSCEWHQEKTAFGTLMPFTALFIASVVFPPFSGFISDNLGIPFGVALSAVCAAIAAVFSVICRRASAERG